MKIILLKSHEKLGNPGDILNVKPGFARNYLFPQKIAQLATESNIKSLKSWVEQQEKHEAKNRANIELLSKYLNKLVLKFELESSDDDKLFGSVTSQMISKEIENQGYSVDKKEIILEEPIKNIGNHYVEIDLDFDPKPKIKIKISAANQ